MIRATIARMSDVPALRASDAERERTVVLLREHAAQGRLTLEEFTKRMSAAYGAGMESGRHKQLET